MLNLIRARIKHGKQFVPDIQKAQLNEAFRGLPIINKSLLTPDILSNCAEICPSDAINTEQISIDMGKCVFCGDCERCAGSDAIKFTNFHHTGSTSREYLIQDGSKTSENYKKEAMLLTREITKMFGRSLKLRSVSAGGCNACEYELNACSNVNFDMGRFGIDIVASPRHADGIVITGPVSANMASALLDTYKAVPEPKIVIAMGSCAISGGIFKDSPAIDRSFFEKHKVDLFIPGCPTHPLTFINAVLDFLGRK